MCFTHKPHYFVRNAFHIPSYAEFTRLRFFPCMLLSENRLPSQMNSMVCEKKHSVLISGIIQYSVMWQPNQLGLLFFIMAFCLPFFLRMQEFLTAQLIGLLSGILHALKCSVSHSFYWLLSPNRGRHDNENPCYRKGTVTSIQIKCIQDQIYWMASCTKTAGECLRSLSK